MPRKRSVATTLLLLLAGSAAAQVPPPPAESAQVPWSFPWGEAVPGAMSASSLVDKPAGALGPVVARDGHFDVGAKRIRFVGVNLAFSANFPAKPDADALAKRFASFGVNCVRFHHMDNQPFPSGIFADRELEKLSPEALDRLDYFIAALKREGVYTNLNLHVSRPWSRTKKWPNADKLEGYDKQVDIFHPELIEANKRFARDLLTHENPYTKTRYADEPAVAMVEINNEDTIFLWGGEQTLADLPEPYAGMLQKQWNDWLVKEYGGREKLAAAWAVGAEPLGERLVDSPEFEKGKPSWVAEQHGAAKMKVERVDVADAAIIRIDVAEVDGTDWHLQYNRPGVKLKKGKFYTLEFKASSAEPRKIGVSIGMAHAPWQNLGLQRSVALDRTSYEHRFGFVATADDDNARISFAVGGAKGTVLLKHLSLYEGGRTGLRGWPPPNAAGPQQDPPAIRIGAPPDVEDPAAGTVARGGMGGSDSPGRTRDWYRFLQHVDQSYFVGMRDWLQKELGVKAPITGTIGLGMLGTMSQSHMDFVDAHAYWDHPRFPRRQWDMKDWVIHNKPMVDDPAGSTLWPLAATRVLGKPFTVTEYNHAHPNEWQAECVPMIFAYAALQDWDAVFLFDYSGNTRWQKQNAENFFSVEGNAAKWAALPAAARLFLAGDIKPSEATRILQPTPMQLFGNASPYFYNQWPFLRDVMGVKWNEAMTRRLSVWYTWKPLAPDASPADGRIRWTAGGPGTGRFVVADDHAAVFTGFAKGAMPIDAGPLKILRLDSPFAAIQLVSASQGKAIANADRLLLSALARQSADGEAWNAERTSVSNQFGKPPAKVELVRGQVELAVAQPMKVWALGPDGQRMGEVPAQYEAGRLRFDLGTQPTVWYELSQ